MKYKIAMLPGDGIGKDVMEAAQIVLNAIELDAEYIYGDVGWEFWKKEGNPLPDRTIELLKETDCCLFGAITSKPKKEAQEELPAYLKGKVEYFSPIVKLRQMFDLYANVRPCKAYEGNPLNYRDDIDIVIFRENTEGLYSGVEHFVDESRTAAESIKIITRKASERIIRFAFEYARKEKRKKVTLAHKANILKFTDGLFLEIGREISSQYPDVEFEDRIIDNMCMQLVKKPYLYDIIVTMNLYGDILSDLCAGLVGGLGLAPSANIGEELAIFEPVHGSAPKYTGKNKVNPCATILSGAMMLKYLGEREKGEIIYRAVEEVIREGRFLTYDLVEHPEKSAGTKEMGTAIAEKVKELLNA